MRSIKSGAKRRTSVADILSRQWWVGLGVLLATAVAVLGYLFAARGTTSYSNTGPCSAQGKWQYGQLLWPQFGDEPVNERSSPRLRYAALLALLICIVFTQAGCSVSSVTNNGNCDAQGGDNAIKCAQSAKGASSSSARNRSAASNPRLRPSGPVPPTALCSARTLLSYPRATGCR